MEQMLRLFVIPNARAGAEGVYKGAEGVYKAPPPSPEHGRWRQVVTGDKDGHQTTTQSNAGAWAAHRAAVLRSMSSDTHATSSAGDVRSKCRLGAVVEVEHEGRSDGVEMRRIEFESVLASGQTE